MTTSSDYGIYIDLLPNKNYLLTSIYADFQSHSRFYTTFWENTNLIECAKLFIALIGE